MKKLEKSDVFSLKLEYIQKILQGLNYHKTMWGQGEEFFKTKKSFGLSAC